MTSAALMHRRVDQDAFDVRVGRISLNAVVTRSRVRAAADIEEVRRSPPYSLMMSIVAMARPAPLTIQPILPSSFT